MNTKVDSLFFLWAAMSLDEYDYKGMSIEGFWDKVSPMYDKFEILNERDVAEKRVEQDGGPASI